MSAGKPTIDRTIEALEEALFRARRIKSGTFQLDLNELADDVAAAGDLVSELQVERLQGLSKQ